MTAKSTKVFVGIAVAVAMLGIGTLIRLYIRDYQIKIATPITRPTVTVQPLLRSLATGFNYVHQFNVSAPPSGHDLSLKGLAFVMDVNLPSGFSLNTLAFGSSDSTSVLGYGVFANDSSCGFAPSANHRCLRLGLTNECVIHAGTIKRFFLSVILATPSNRLYSGNSISTTLLGDGEPVYGTLSGSSPSFGINGTLQNFVWSDLEASPHSLVSDDWWNGNYVYGLPMAAFTVSVP